MARLKIDYGIDLGTTNSAICRMVKGEPIIIKTDVLKDTMPSCLSINRRGSITVGDSGYNTMKQDKRRATKSWKLESSNTYVEFKRTMATNTRYLCSNLNKNFTSEELSSEVLKTLKAFITDENISSAVITVPAKFTVNQKTSTIEAAKMAGFKRCELLQEPIAASMAYGLTSNNKNGIWLVFDFGGGTFDAALLKVEEGIQQVFDTEGDNYLGGKNLDYAIVDHIIIPDLMNKYEISSIMADADKKEVLRDAMKTYAEDVKNQLSFKEREDILSNLGDLGVDDEGEEIELDLTVTQNELYDVIRPYFQKAVDICKSLLKRNNLTGDQIDKLILVGGPTYSPLIRQMLKEQITLNVDTSIDPMTAVATGAALYASTLDAEINEEEMEVDTVILEMSYESTTVDPTTWIPVKLADKMPLSRVWVEFVRGDKAWSSGKVEIDKTGNVVEAHLLESKPNFFSVVVYDEKGNRFPCFPAEITIIQGTKVGAAPLPYNIGIAISGKGKERGVFRMAKGLEKNKPIPAVGVVNDLRTPKQLRPGVENDKLSIPIYQVDGLSADAEGRSASLYEYIGDVQITGDDVENLIPMDSLVDVTLKADSSEQMSLEVHFLALDFTVEKKLDTSKKHSIENAKEEVRKSLVEAQRSINQLKDAGISVEKLQSELDRVKEEYANSSEHKAILQHLKEVLRLIEDKDVETEWERLDAELREEFDRLEKAQNSFGNEKSAQLIEQLRSQTDQVIRCKDVRMGREVLEQINGLFFQLTLVYQCMGLIEQYNARFGSVRWKDAARARQLLNMGMEEANNQPTAEKLLPIARSLIELMPEDAIGNVENDLLK